VLKCNNVCQVILEILQRDGRIPFSRIAREVGLSEATIHLRIKRLRESGVLKGFTAIIDPEKIGKNTLAFVLVRTDVRRHNEVLSEIAAIKDVQEAYDITGEYSALVKIRVGNREELAQVLDQIAKIEGVRETETLYVLRVIKEEKSIKLD
jgi:Lrp/AsnC family transcriptional regulator for asnA, asnC and gidA